MLLYLSEALIDELMRNGKWIMIEKWQLFAGRLSLEKSNLDDVNWFKWLIVIAKFNYRQNPDVYEVKIVGAILRLRSGGFGRICCDRGECLKFLH